MKNPSFETIQNNLVNMLKLTNVKIGTKKANEFEHVYVHALRDANIQIPVVVDMMLLSGRSVAGYKVTTKNSRNNKVDVGVRAQLGFDDSDGTYADGYEA